MTPEQQILEKYLTTSVWISSDPEDYINAVRKCMQEYASLREQEIAAAAWDAAINYVNNGGYDDAQIDAPNKEEYLKSLK